MRYEKALEFAKYEYNRTMGYHGESCVQPYEDIALILKALGYGVEHHITALFMNILNETDASAHNVMSYCNMQVMEAIRLMEVPRNCEKMKHMMTIKSNEFAFPVKMAEQLYKLRNTDKKTKEELRKLLHETEDYYLKCAHDTIFYEPMFQALVECRSRVGLY